VRYTYGNEIKEDGHTIIQVVKLKYIRKLIATTYHSLKDIHSQITVVEVAHTVIQSEIPNFAKNAIES